MKTITPSILQALGGLGDRKLFAVPLHWREFVHATYVLPCHDYFKVDETADIQPLSFGECHSERGQLVCSCGLYALAWEEP